MKLELIKWIDARSLEGWNAADDKELYAGIIETTGTVFKETADVVCVGSSITASPTLYSGVMVIPKVCIVERWAVGPITSDGTDLPAEGSEGVTEFAEVTGKLIQPKIVPDLRAKVVSLLVDAFPSPAWVTLKEGDEIIGIVASKQFEGMDSMQRHDMVWAILDKGLEPDERKQILAVVAVTPTEHIGHSTGG